MAKQDFYELLGVGRDASPDDIKKAFRKLAMQCHPDRHPGDETAEHRFKDLNEAYDVLKDEQKRAAYDRFGHQAFEGGMGARGSGPGGPGGGMGGFDFTSNFADIFEDFFGGFTESRRGGATGPS